jgi:hypothetical protein
VQSVFQIVLRIALTMNSGEAPAYSGNGATATVLFRPAELPPTSPEPSDLKSSATIKRYPFGVIFSKESLEDFMLNPRSKTPFRKYALLF